MILLYPLLVVKATHTYVCLPHAYWCQWLQFWISTSIRSTLNTFWSFLLKGNRFTQQRFWLPLQIRFANIRKRGERQTALGMIVAILGRHGVAGIEMDFLFMIGILPVPRHLLLIAIQQDGVDRRAVLVALHIAAALHLYVEEHCILQAPCLARLSGIHKTLTILMRVFIVHQQKVIRLMIMLVFRVCIVWARVLGTSLF